MIRPAALMLTAIAFAVPAAAHHSYAPYHMDQLITIDGTIESFEWINPHSLVKVRTPHGLKTLEWLPVNGMVRAHVNRDFFTPGERVVVKGNPHREYAQNGIVHLKSLCRMSDRWEFPAGACADD